MAMVVLGLALVVLIIRSRLAPLARIAAWAAHQNVARALSLSNQLGIRQRAPLTLRDGHDSVMGESLPNARIDALV